MPRDQAKMLKETQKVLASIAKDVRAGLLETVGIESSFSTADERCSMILELPDGSDAELIARAIDLENVEAWTDKQNKVHLGISPWFSTKDVDQTVLCAIKVVHVLLGVHASDKKQPKTLTQKLLASVLEIMETQKKTG